MYQQLAWLHASVGFHCGMASEVSGSFFPNSFKLLGTVYTEMGWSSWKRSKHEISMTFHKCMIKPFKL